MPEKISIIKDSGETISSNIVSVFMIPDTEKKYIITTENAVDPHGLTVLHVSEIVDGGLQKIATDEEWSSIKTIMRAIISGNVGSYQYLPSVESIKAASQYSRDISVSAAASKQMIDNYATAEKSNVAITPASGSGIFPAANGASADAEDELIPGISEVDAVPSASAMLPNQGVIPNNVMSQPAVDTQMTVPTQVEPQSVVPQNGFENNISVVPGNTQVLPVVNPMMEINNGMVSTTEIPVVNQEVAPVGKMPVNNVVVPDMNVVNPQFMNQPMNNNVMTVPTMPVADVVTNPVPVTAMPVNPMINQVDATAPVMENVMNNDVIVPGNISNFVSQPMEVVPMDASNIQINSEVVTPTPIVVNEETEIVQPAVQVLQPSVIVPTAQIAQEAQTNNIVPPVEINVNATPSFAPDASLDEVIVAAQDMFMEGVKNLVQTIQEKLYREIYTKEAELKKREADLENREKFVGDQMMMLMSNFAAMQGRTLPAMPDSMSTMNENNENK